MWGTRSGAPTVCTRRNLSMGANSWESCAPPSLSAGMVSCARCFPKSRCPATPSRYSRRSKRSTEHSVVRLHGLQQVFAQEGAQLGFDNPLLDVMRSVGIVACLDVRPAFPQRAGKPHGLADWHGAVTLAVKNQDAAIQPFRKMLNYTALGEHTLAGPHLVNDRKLGAERSLRPQSHQIVGP